MFEDAIIEISKLLNATIIYFVLESVSGSYGFAKYNPTKQRSFFFSDGHIMEEFGSPLKEEHGLNINEHISEEDFLQVAENFGIDFEAEKVSKFIVKELKDKQIQNPIQYLKNQKTKEIKPWWKLW